MNLFKTRLLAFLLLGATASAALVSVGQAQPRRTDPIALIDQRQARMKAIGGSMKTLAGIAKGEANVAEARKAAAVLTAAQNMHLWWPAGTAKGVGDSDASPAIWKEQQAFLRRVVEYRLAATAMDKAARSGDVAQIRAALPALGASCKSCHKPYRLED